MNKLTPELLTTAALNGIGVEIITGDNGQVSYNIYEPGLDAVETTNAATEIHRRIKRLDDAQHAAMKRAEQWNSHRANTTANIEAWNALAELVNAELPAGAQVPILDTSTPYGLSGLQPMTALIADLLAQHHTAQADKLARHKLENALAAEGAKLVELNQDTFRPDYWETTTGLRRPVQLVQDIPNDAQISGGLVEIDQDTRRAIAWKHYGIPVPRPRDALEASLAQLDKARAAVTNAARRAQSHAEAIAAHL